jgi:hypothetical protein
MAKPRQECPQPCSAAEGEQRGLEAQWLRLKEAWEPKAMEAGEP